MSTARNRGCGTGRVFMFTVYHNVKGFGNFGYTNTLKSDEKLSRSIQLYDTKYRLKDR